MKNDNFVLIIFIRIFQDCTVTNSSSVSCTIPELHIPDSIELPDLYTTRPTSTTTNAPARRKREKVDEFESFNQELNIELSVQNRAKRDYLEEMAWSAEKSNNDVIWRTRRDVNNLKVYEGCDSYRQAPDEIEFYVDFLLDGTLAFESRAKEELCVYRAPVLEEMVPNLQKYKKGELLTIKVNSIRLNTKYCKYILCYFCHREMRLTLV